MLIKGSFDLFIAPVSTVGTIQATGAAAKFSTAHCVAVALLTGFVRPGDGLLVEFAVARQASAVVRGLRAVSASRGMLFYRLLQQAVVTDPVTYANIVQSAA